MTKEEFNSILARTPKDYRKRPLLVATILENQHWVAILLNNMSAVTDERSNFSARMLELSCKEELSILLPYLDLFSELIAKLKLDGSSRTSSKLIEMLTVQYFIKYNSVYIERLSTEILEKFTERCFDWMITDRAIAIQAHSMYALYLLGTKFEWIHPELILQIERKLPTGSTGYKNRGRKIIRAITTNQLLKLQAQ